MIKYLLLPHQSSVQRQLISTDGFSWHTTKNAELNAWPAIKYRPSVEENAIWSLRFKLHRKYAPTCTSVCVACCIHTFEQLSPHPLLKKFIVQPYARHLHTLTIIISILFAWSLTSNTYLAPSFFSHTISTKCPHFRHWFILNIVVYLPHARTVESRKPRNARNNRITSVYSSLLGAGQCTNEPISGSHVTCPQRDIPDATIGTT
jgi:hypothetical protein